MRRFSRLSLLAVTFAASSVAHVLPADDAGGTSVTVVTDRPSAIYKVGETARFVISAKRGNQPLPEADFAYALSLDGGRQISDGHGTLGAGPAEISGSLDTPGFLRCTVSLKSGDKTVTGIAAAAYDPDKIQPTAVEPPDFVGFWAAEKAKLGNIPMHAQLTAVPACSDKDVNVYKVRLGNINGSHVYGWIGVPTKPGKYPAVLTVPAAGWNPPSPRDGLMAKSGALWMTIYAHDLEPDMPADQYAGLPQGALKEYYYQGRESRDTYYFRRVFLSCVRSIDYITSRADWNGKHMIVNGSSQGGGLSIVAAGLDSRVTAIAANVPALCDHTGRFFGRTSGWPQLIPGDDAKIRAVSAYFDAVNFARHVTCPTLMAVGYIDTTCAPSSVYSAFNVIHARKKMVPSPLLGHAWSPEYNTAIGHFLREQMKTQTPGR